jgi:hypothetical protein
MPIAAQSKPADAAMPNDGLPLLRSRRFWAERLDVHEITLMRSYRCGELEGIRIGDRVLHSPDQIDRYIKRATARRAAIEKSRPRRRPVRSCQGRTKLGKPCRSESTSGRSYCRHHDPERDQPHTNDAA